MGTLNVQLNHNSRLVFNLVFPSLIPVTIEDNNCFFVLGVTIAPLLKLKINSTLSANQTFNKPVYFDIFEKSAGGRLGLKEGENGMSLIYGEMNTTRIDSISITNRNLIRDFREIPGKLKGEVWLMNQT